MRNHRSKKELFHQPNRKIADGFSSILSKVLEGSSSFDVTKYSRKDEVQALREAYRHHALVSKSPAAGSSAVTRTAASHTLLECEGRCRATNERLRRGHISDSTRQILDFARDHFRKVFGPYSDSTLLTVIGLGRHGPGSSLTNTRGRVSQYFKYSDLPYSCSSRAMPYFQYAISSDRAWMDILLDKGIPFVPSSRLHAELMAFKAWVQCEEDDGIAYRDWETDRKSTRLNSSHRL